MGGEDVVAEEAVVDGDDPVGQRRFFEIADAVDVEGDPVAAGGDVLGGLGVGGVGVVEQRGRKEGGKIDGDEDEQERSPCARRGGAERRLAGRELRVEFSTEEERSFGRSSGESSE